MRVTRRCERDWNDENRNEKIIMEDQPIFAQFCLSFSFFLFLSFGASKLVLSSIVSTVEFMKKKLANLTVHCVGSSGSEWNSSNMINNEEILTQMKYPDKTPTTIFTINWWSSFQLCKSNQVNYTDYQLFLLCLKGNQCRVR